MDSSGRPAFEPQHGIGSARGASHHRGVPEGEGMETSAETSIETGVTATSVATSSGVRSLQILVVVLCMLINVLDGYDLQAAAFTTTRIMAEWGVAPGALGFTILSPALLGVGL